MKTIKSIFTAILDTITAIQTAKAESILKNGHTRRWE
jgi:hypothetical protein